MPCLQCQDNARDYVAVAFVVGISRVSDLTRLRYNPGYVEYISSNKLRCFRREENLASLHDLATKQLVCRSLRRRREHERLEPRRYLLTRELCYSRANAARVYISRYESFLLRDNLGELVELLLVLAPV